MENLKTAIRFISNSIVRIALAIIFVMVYSVSVAATSNTQNLLQKMIDGLFSGEVIAIALAGVTGYFLNRARTEGDRRKEESAELGRLRFKQENFESTRDAVREGMGVLQGQLQPKLEQIDDSLDDLRIRIERIETKADEALRKSELLEKTQSNWVTMAEDKLSKVISCESGKPVLVRELFHKYVKEEDDYTTR